MSAGRVTMADVTLIENVALEVRAVGAILLKLGEDPGTIDDMIASWLGGVLVQASRRLNEPCERIAEVARGRQS